MAGRLLEEAGAVYDRPAFRVTRRKDQLADPRKADRPGAHRAGLKRDVHVQVGQAVPAAAASPASSSARAIGERVIVMGERSPYTRRK